MKVVLLLAAVALALFSAQAEAGARAVESAEAGSLQRQLREPRRRSMKRKKTGKKKPKKTGKKKQRRAKVRKAGKGRQGGRAECLAEVVQAIKNYKKAQSQYRQGNRISSWTKNMDKKKEKAADQFQNSSEALDSATGGGLSCNGGGPDSDAAEAVGVLKNCSTTAAMKCDSTVITNLSSSKLETCKTETKNYMDAFDECVRTATCGCFTALPAFDKDMCDMGTTYDSAKASKTMCNSPSEKGSFGECSKKQKEAGHLVGKCKKSCDSPVMTTMVSRLNARRKFA